MSLEREFDYFIQHQEELVQAHRGRVVAIKNNQVLGVYDSEIQAVEQTARAHELGTFLVQRCNPGPEAYTRVFHLPVAV